MIAWKNPALWRPPLTMLLLVSVMFFASCEKQSGAAVVIGKDYVPAETGPAVQDSRATATDQWIVQAEMAGDGVKVSVRVDRARFDSLNVGDRVQVSYAKGKYTGTIWGSELK